MKIRHPKHVALIIDNQKKAGTQNQAAMLGRELARTGCRVTMILLEHPADAPLPVVPGVEMISTPVSPLNTPAAIKDLFALAACLRRIAPDVAHTFLFKANLIGALAARLAGVRVVVGSRRSLGYDIIGRRRQLARLANRLVDGVVVNAEAILAAAQEIEGGPLPTPIVIPNGVDIPTATDRVRPDTKTSPAIGILGNIRPIKGHDVALKAFHQLLLEHPDAQLHLMGDRDGDQDWTRSIDTLIRDLSLAGRVHWHPANQPVSSFFQHLDILVSASNSEGMPNAVLEGMAAGLPIVATDVGGTSEVLGTSGTLVAAGDPQGLASAISRLLADSSLLELAGHSGHNRAKELFLPSALALRHLEWYGRMQDTGARYRLALPWIRPRRKVLLAIDMLDTGGTEQQMIHWTRGLRREGVAVEIMCLRKGGRVADQLSAEGTPVHVLNKRFRFDPLFLLRQQFLLLKIRPMTVLALLTTAGIWTLPFARLAGVPRVLFSMRATTLTDDPNDNGPISLLTQSLRFAHRIIGNSAPVVEYCSQTLGVEKDRTILLPNAIGGVELRGTSRRQLRMAKNLPVEGPLFGIVARLVPVKDHSLFLQTCLAMKKLMPNARALIIGDGPLMEQLGNEISDLGLQADVLLLGHSNDTLELIRALDALVLTSRSEGSPNAVLEALTVGTPVVSVDVGDVASLVGRDDGKVVTGRAPEDLATALHTVLLRPHPSADTMSETARKHHPGLVLESLRDLVFATDDHNLTLSQGAR